jgi:hypothetical protein
MTPSRACPYGRQMITYETAGCQWLHVDFEDYLRPFYVGSCGFRPTNAGLMPL